MKRFLTGEIMKYRFALGLGRSGTTFLGRLLSLTTTPIKFINEPIPGLDNQVLQWPFFVDPRDHGLIGTVRKQITMLGESNEIIRKECEYKIERDDSDLFALLAKDVHNLLTYPEYLSNLDYKVVVITRNTTRVLDSYMVKYNSGNKEYLVGETKYISSVLRSGASTSILLEKAISRTSPLVKTYLSRPLWLTQNPYRIAATMEVLRNYLISWAELDDRVIHVSHEDLCDSPIDTTRKLYDFLGMTFDDSVLSGIVEMTTGNSDEYYSTTKDSKKILEQKYRYLSDKQLRKVRRLIHRD